MLRGDMEGYGAYGTNGARWDPRAHMGPSGRALRSFRIPPYPSPTTYIDLDMCIYELMNVEINLLKDSFTSLKYLTNVFVFVLIQLCIVKSIGFDRNLSDKINTSTKLKRKLTNPIGIYRIPSETVC